MKIPWAAMPVRVQVPSEVLNNQSKDNKQCILPKIDFL